MESPIMFAYKTIPSNVFRIHSTSKDAQLKILNILCMNAASFYNNLHSEYVTVILKLVQYYKEYVNDQTKEITLQNFKSEQIDIPNVQLNLEPIFVTVKDLQTCKTLIDLTLQLLAETLATNSVYIYNHKIEFYKLFSEVLYMLEHFSVDLKYVSLKFFIDLIVNYSQIGICNFNKCFPFVYLDLLYSIQAMVKSINIFYEKNEVNVMYLEDFNKLMLRFMKMNEECPDRENKNIILDISTVILKTKDNNIFNRELKLQCLALNKYIDFPIDMIDVLSMDSVEIDVLRPCYSKNILLHIEANMQTVMSRPLLHENWYYQRILEVIRGLNRFDYSRLDNYLIGYHMKRSLSGLAVLKQVLIQCQNLKDYSNTSLISRQDIHTIWESLLKFLQYHRSLVLRDNDCMKCIMDIVLSTFILEKLTQDECNKLLQLICLQTTQHYSEPNLSFPDNVRAIILKYLLLSRIIIKTNLSDVWLRIISNLFNGLMKNKNVYMYREVCFFFTRLIIIFLEELLFKILILF